MFLYNVPKFLFRKQQSSRVVLPQALLAKWVSILFPPKCIFCGKYGENICDICIKRLEKLKKTTIVKFKNKNLDLLIYFFKYEKLIASTWI